jgi:hypothetical protein
MRGKAKLMSHNLYDRLQLRAKGRYRFVTLTLKHSRIPLADQIRRLYASFKKLRTKPLWKRTTEGGCLILEVKWELPDADSLRGGWHVHLHAIVEGNWIAQRELSAAWLEATGDSTIVDIRPVSSAQNAAHYLTKYVTKSVDHQVWSDVSAAQEWVLASKGVRCCATFGSWRGFRLLAHPQTATDWIAVCKLETLIARAQAGEVAAQQLLIILRPPGHSDPIAVHQLDSS